MVVIALAKHPIPSRTRPLRANTPMVLRLKTWESRSPPNLARSQRSLMTIQSPISSKSPRGTPKATTASLQVAGWSSPVARQAHNLKVAGSNPAPATNTNSSMISMSWASAAVHRPLTALSRPATRGAFCVCAAAGQWKVNKRAKTRREDR